MQGKRNRGRQLVSPRGERPRARSLASLPTRFPTPEEERGVVMRSPYSVRVFQAGALLLAFATSAAGQSDPARLTSRNRQPESKSVTRVQTPTAPQTQTQFRPPQRGGWLPLRTIVTL